MSNVSGNEARVNGLLQPAQAGFAALRKPLGAASAASRYLDTGDKE